MTTTVRWGILGTAHINRRLIPALRAARRSELIAIASRRAERAAEYARDWSIANTHGSYDALLRDRGVDAVYIPLPNSLHVEWTLRALDAGKHVLCEKPLALHPEEVDRIAAVARARSLVVAEAFMYRHEPLVSRALDLLRDGVVGPLWMVNSGFTYQQSRPDDVRLDAELGGGSLWDIGCYAVSAVRLVVQAEPQTALGMAIRGPELPSDAAVDQAFSGLLRFPNNVVASIHSSFRSVYRTWLEVSGAEGVMRVPNPFRPGAREEIEVERGGVVTRIPVDGSPALFVRQVDDFVAAALDGRPSAVSLADSRGNAAALAALHASARAGAAVTI